MLPVKRSFLIATAFLLAQPLYSQPAPGSDGAVVLELAGAGGAYSLNYEQPLRPYGSTRENIAVRGGVALYPFESYGTMLVPLGLHAMLGSPLAVEVSAGFTTVFHLASGDETEFYPWGRVGFRAERRTWFWYVNGGGTRVESPLDRDEGRRVLIPWFSLGLGKYLSY
jgi:hypothetical protein